MRQQEVEQLKMITLEQVCKFHAQYIPQSAKGRRRLAVHVVSCTHTEEAVEQSTDDLDAFKQDLAVCPLPATPCLAK